MNRKSATDNPDPFPFIPGRELSQKFYFEIVQPILQNSYPNLIYSAGLLGMGSEVLGFDTEMSTDHNWGPRLGLFLSGSNYSTFHDRINRTLANELPLSFQRISTHFEDVIEEPGTVILKPATERPISHRIEIFDLEPYLDSYLGTNFVDEPTTADWLTIPEQKLRSITEGVIFHDGLNRLHRLQAILDYYPRDIWHYLISAEWEQIGQEEAFIGRSGIVDDELGSSLLAARQVSRMMRLSFLLERTYAPYSKWFGSAFTHLTAASKLTPHFKAAMQSEDWRQRERHLGEASLILLRITNDLKITGPIPEQLHQFHARPFFVIQGSQIARRIWDSIQDAQIKKLPYGVGKIDQYTGNSDILSNGRLSRSLAQIYT